MLAPLSPVLHYRRRSWSDPATWIVCAQLADLVVVLAMDDNLHPARSTRTVSPGISDVIDSLAQTVGPVVVLLLLAAALYFGTQGELMLGVLGVMLGGVLIWATVGTEGLSVYMICTVLLRIVAAAMVELFVWPLRVLGLVALLGAGFWMVTR